MSLILQKELARRNYEVSVANDGRSAVEFAQKVDYDVIVMDMTMPQMDGIQALKVIKQMLDAGISLQSARKAVESLREFDEGLASVRVVIQGPSVVLAQSDEQVMDLLRGGQGVLSVVLDIEPLQQTITQAVQLAFDTDGTPRVAAR